MSESPMKSNDMKKNMKESKTDNFGSCTLNNKRKVLEYQLKQSM